MSIASEISRISQNVSDSLDAVAAKGVTVPSGSNSDDLAELIALIPTGGGGMTVVETTDEHGGTIVTITGEEVTLQAKSATPTTSSQTIQPDSGYTGLSSVTVGAIPSQYIVPTGTKAITENGTGIDVTNYASVNVNVSNPSTEPVLQDKTVSITPSETAQSQTVSADSGYDGLDEVTVNVGAISSTYVGSGITQRSSSDLTASGGTVTVPSGYYASQVSKSVSAMTLPTSASASATSGYASKATIGRSASDQYINIPAGYNSAGAYYKVSAVPNAEFNLPSISVSNATISTGTNTITLSKTNLALTPNVTAAGYFSGGNGSISADGLSLTASVTTKAAATYYPSASDQTIASGVYTTGTQTIKAVTTSGISAANIKAGVTVKVGDTVDDDRIAGVTGTFTSDATAAAGDIVSGKSAYVNGSKVDGSLVVQHYYTGSSAPSSSLGSDGDIYLQTS